MSLPDLLENGCDQIVAEVIALCPQGLKQRCTGRRQTTLLGEHQHSGSSQDPEPLATGFCPSATVIEDREQLQSGRFRSRSPP